MESVDLDNVLERTRDTIRYLSDLDLTDKFEDVSIGIIMNNIDKLSQNMIQSNEKIHIRKDVRAQANHNSSFIRNLKKIDRKLNKITIYHKCRPFLRNKIDRIYNKKYINGKELLVFENEEFVDVVYRSILFREPDAEGKMNALNYVTGNSLNKVGFIYSLSKAPEAKNYNITIKGIKGKRFLLSLKSRIYDFPVLGYPIRWILNIVLLPKKIGNIQNSLKDLYYHIKLLNTRAVNIESVISDKTDYENVLMELHGKEEKLISYQTRLKNYQIELNTKVETIEKYIVDNNLLMEEAEKNKHREKDIMDKFYLRYNESLMIDTREEVKSRAKIYIDKLNLYFINRNKNELALIDLGCGECEWIELLMENGYQAKGVDSNSLVVNKVKTNYPEIEIAEMDAFSCLKSLDDNSQDLITSLHMVEHLDMMSLIRLLEECKRVLKKGGIIILETPNPLNILTSTYYFHLDPTHNKPIPPELLAFFVEESGIKVKEKILLYPLDFVPYIYKEEDPIKDIVYRFNMEQAYSILAVNE